MFSKPIDSINSEDINNLIDNQIDERRTLDYKRDLPNKDDNSKAEFCKDVSSFANTVGGYLIFGLAEATDSDKKGLGYPDVQKSKGLDESNLNERTHDLEKILVSGLDPRIQGINFKPVHNVGPKGDLTVLVVQIPNSWSKPHRVKSTLKAPFWMRHSKGAFDLSTSEIRAAFLSSESAAERTRNFKLQRLSVIYADEAPILCSDKPLAVLHIVPIECLVGGRVLSPEEMTGLYGSVQPLNGGTHEEMFNLDGYTLLNQQSYVQLFRDGSLETVSIGMLNGGEGERKNIPTRLIENSVTRFVFEASKFYRANGINPPLHLSLTLANVRGFALLTPRFGVNPPINRDLVHLPGIELYELPDHHVEAGNLLRPIFDALANAVHLQRSRSYDSDGRFRPGV